MRTRLTAVSLGLMALALLGWGISPTPAGASLDSTVIAQGNPHGGPPGKLKRVEPYGAPEPAPAAPMQMKKVIGGLYAIGTNSVAGGFGIFQWAGSNWMAMSGGGTDITVDSTGTPWIINANKEIYRWAGNAWAKAPGSAMDIGAGGGQVYVVGTDSVPGGYSIYRWTPKAVWEKVPGGAVRIDVDSSGSPWIVNANNEIYQMSMGNWRKLPGSALDIGVGGSQAWVIGTNSTSGGYGIYQLMGNRWESRPGGGVRIDADSRGNAYVVNVNNLIYQWVGTSWAQMPGQAKDIAAQ